MSTSTATFNLCMFKMSTNNCPAPLAINAVALSGVLRHKAAIAAQPISAKAGMLCEERMNVLGVIRRREGLRFTIGYKPAKMKRFELISHLMIALHLGEERRLILTKKPHKTFGSPIWHDNGI